MSKKVIANNKIIKNLKESNSVVREKKQYDLTSPEGIKQAIDNNIDVFKRLKYR